MALIYNSDQRRPGGGDQGGDRKVCKFACFVF